MKYQDYQDSFTILTGKTTIGEEEEWRLCGRTERRNGSPTTCGGSGGRDDLDSVAQSHQPHR